MTCPTCARYAFATPPCKAAEKLRVNWYKAMERNSESLSARFKNLYTRHLAECEQCQERARERNEIAERIT